MGLAAGQARLLTITGRKSDCEFESMRLSHQKIALARELADLSNNYQNSLTKTKLIYDYYGTGDTNTPLTYSTLMTASKLNDYMPTLLTDSMGRVTLTSDYAAAAAAAGIPQEGLGCLPSEIVRNQFVQALASAGSGLITQDFANKITALPYNQATGFGGGTTVAVLTESGNINDLLEHINVSSTQKFTIEAFQTGPHENVKGDNENCQIMVKQGSNASLDSGSYDFSLYELLKDGADQYYLDSNSIKGEVSPVWATIQMQNYLSEPGGFIEWLYEEFASALDIDLYTAQALEYALNETKTLICGDVNNSSYINARNAYAAGPGGGSWDEKTQWSDKDGKDYSASTFLGPVGTKITDDIEDYISWLAPESVNYIGFVYAADDKYSWCEDDGDNDSTASINLNNIAKAFLTYFADFMNGVAAIDSKGNEVFEVAKGKIESGSRLATDNYVYQYTWAVGTTVSSDDLAVATFYDTLLNQICMNGWAENDNVKDPEYLQQMLQNGMLYISKAKDDGYYYQGNYSIDTYIKEIEDTRYIADAEAKYTTEKAKLNAKEETLDMKMKNLDTEISALTTEYDTVKNTISKNIEKSFKRYSA